MASRRHRSTWLLVLALLLTSDGTAPGACRGTHWLAVWAASPSDARTPGYVDQTLRLVVHPTFGGRRVRVRLSNRFGSQPVLHPSSAGYEAMASAVDLARLGTSRCRPARAGM